MAPDPVLLHKVRMQDVYPFSVTGVNFTRALYVPHRGEETKVYVFLFTCATIRAIHLKARSCRLINRDISNSFLCLASRRSTPQLMISNNVTTFQSAAEEMLSSLEEVRTILYCKEVTWKFIHKKDLWFGGFWECLVVLAKSAIKRYLAEPTSPCRCYSGNGNLTE